LEFQYPSRRIFIGSHSLPPLRGRLIGPSVDEDGAPIYDEEIGNDETEIQPNEGDNNCFISQCVLSVTAVKEENNQRHNFFTLEA
jgi:hypothetical protein